MDCQGGFLISQIKQISGRVLSKILAERNITEFNGAQGRILYILWQGDSISIKEIATKTGLAKTSLTGMLDHMEKIGLIQRIYVKEDRRKTLIKLTEKAQSLKFEFDEVSRAMSTLIYKGFSKAEILSFEENLKRILANLET